jgi:hypothetical protein
MVKIQLDRRMCFNVDILTLQLSYFIQLDWSMMNICTNSDDASWSKNVDRTQVGDEVK